MNWVFLVFFGGGGVEAGSLFRTIVGLPRRKKEVNFSLGTFHLESKVHLSWREPTLKLY